MKNGIFILVIFAFQIAVFGQSDCSWNWTRITVLTSDTDHVLLDFIPKKEISISLFAEYDFLNENEYQLIFRQEIDGRVVEFLIDDERILKRLQYDYRNTQSVFNDTCNHHGAHSLSGCLTKKKRITEIFDYDASCGILKTKCGPLYFDSRSVIDAARKIKFNEFRETMNTLSKLNSRLAELQNDEGVFLLDSISTYVGQVEFIYFDEDDKVSQILNDTFWLKLIDEEMSIDYRLPMYEGEDVNILREIGEILQRLIKQETKGDYFEVAYWEPLENMTNKYRIKLIFKNKSHLSKLKEPFIYTDISNHTLIYFRERKIE